MHLGHDVKAREFSDEAIALAEHTDSHPYMGSFYFNRALVAGKAGDFDLSIDLYKNAHECFRAAGRTLECANTLANMAQVYFDARRFASSRRAIASAERIAATIQQDGVRARARILLGEIEQRSGRHDRAASRWREAIQIAKNLNDRILQFKAEQKLHEQALALGNRALAASIERRLWKLAPWIPEHVDELRAFRNTRASGTTTAQ
jgi:tetratricopeptide (TPR) repeat protein